MRVVMLDAPAAMLDERHRLGLDGRDEMWDGVLHMVPPPNEAHQGLSSDFFPLLNAHAKGRGLVPRMETGLFRSDSDYRVPDQLYRLPEQGSARGAEGAELVVEIRSAGDDTYHKLEFYAALGVREVLVLHPDDRRIELFRLVEDRLLPVSPNDVGELVSDVLGIRLVTVDGRLQVTWMGGMGGGLGGWCLSRVVGPVVGTAAG